jgi:hypothetical protein
LVIDEVGLFDVRLASALAEAIMLTKSTTNIVKIAGPRARSRGPLLCRTGGFTATVSAALDAFTEGSRRN